MKIIVGDSWAVGEWDNHSRLAGPGFGQMLMLHDQVVNLAMPDGNNTISFKKLEAFLKKYTCTHEDSIYWVTSCPSRDVDVDFFTNVETSMLESIRSVMHQALARMNILAQNYDIKVFLIGGLSDLIDLDISFYPNLEVAVPSWGRLIDKSYNAHLMKCIYWKEVGRRLLDTRPDMFAEWELLADQFLAKEQSWLDMGNKYFTTYGHPDRHAHKLLKDHLWPEWSHKF